jgi:hypothetical protein
MVKITSIVGQTVTNERPYHEVCENFPSGCKNIHYEKYIVNLEHQSKYASNRG